MEPDKCRHSDSRTFMLKPPRFGGRKEAPCSAQTPETKVNEKTFPSMERTPLAALERVVEVSHLKVDQRALWATPSLLKISHASALVLADPVPIV